MQIQMKQAVPWIVRGLVLCSLIAVIAGFWMPWAYLSLRQPALTNTFGNAAGIEGPLKQLTRHLGRVTLKIQRHGQTIVSDLPLLEDIPKQVSGADIPVMVREQKAQVAIALLELLTGQRQDLDRNSVMVYLIPGVALLCGVLLIGWGRHLAVSAGVGALCAILAGGGLWKLSTVNPQTVFVAMIIGPGLWMSVGAYAGVSMAACFAIAGKRTVPGTKRTGW